MGVLNTDSSLSSHGGDRGPGGPARPPGGGASSRVVRRRMVRFLPDGSPTNAFRYRPRRRRPDDRSCWRWSRSSSGKSRSRRRKARAATSTARGEGPQPLRGGGDAGRRGAKRRRVVTLVTEELRGLLFLIECRFDPDVHESRGPVLDTIRRASTTEASIGTWDREGLPNRDVILPVEAGHHHLGSYLLRGPALGSPSPRERRLAAVALSDLAGAALARGSDRVWAPSSN